LHPAPRPRIPRPEMATWFWEMYYPAMSPEDRSIIDALNAAEFSTKVYFTPLENDVQAETGFDFSDESVTIRIAAKYEAMLTPEGQIDFKQIVPILGDELQHAYQFLKGEIGYLNINQAGKIYSVTVRYDLEDEIDSSEGALRAEENYILYHLLKSDEEKSAFFNTKRGRLAGFDLINNGDSNWAHNQVVGYYAFVKNPFKEAKDLISARQYLFSIGYKKSDFDHGGDKEGELTNTLTPKPLASHFPLGSHLGGDQLIIGQAYFIQGKIFVRNYP
jgi:hypothetical protein